MTTGATVTRRLWYCVVRLSDRHVVYCGTDRNEAAKRLYPGTVFGRGRTELSARYNAHCVAQGMMLDAVAMAEKIRSAQPS